MENKSLLPEDLVLKLNEKAKNFDISKYEDFIYELCGEWEFQKEAIRNSIRFFLSDAYNCTEDLFNENYDNNEVMKKFSDKATMSQNLPFPYKKAVTIDLATGTGKSWVIYGVARILLAAGLVDRVLVLCPSRTIKEGLASKFRSFTKDSILTESLPIDAVIKVPGIKHSDTTIEVGDICIDNVHKTYDHVSSSINDSLTGSGLRTLVINDEAHHILNPKVSTDSAEMLEWMRFLNDEKFGFKNILNLTGTPYKGDLYFGDVIYRFSLREAISQRFIKDIEYLEKDQSRNESEKWKAIIANHEKTKEDYPEAKKHMTIVVTKSISDTDKISEEIKSYLKKFTKLSPEEIDKKVLPVTSSQKHEKNRELLKLVDDPISPVEWIVSVSMLTEGWDVSNIFQIVPHEERAFNSKLLISQVLGRGLRIPLEYRGSAILPRVRVFNHASWSLKIDHLVMEVAEISNSIYSNIIKNSPFNFIVHTIRTDKVIKTPKKLIPQKEEVNLPTTLGFSSTSQTREQIFVNARSKRRQRLVTDVGNIIRKYSPEEAVNAIYTNLYLFDIARGTKITSRVSKQFIMDLVKKELKKIGEDFVSEENLQSGKLSFNALLRPHVGFSKIEEIYGDIVERKTESMESSSISESSLKHHGGLITSQTNLKSLDKELLEKIETIKKEAEDASQTTLTGEEYIRAKIIDDLRNEEYKSPLDITLLSYRPEREFAEKLVLYYSKYFDSWIKSRDQGFYVIPYIHRPGTHSLQKDFNPDFLIKKGNKIIVVEIKAEDDSNVKNKDKLEGAISYFEKLNEKLKGKIVYEFHFLDPRDYDLFFDRVLMKGQAFKSQLHATLEGKSREELKDEVTFAPR